MADTTALRISPTLLVHLRIALLGAASVAIEDLWSLTSMIESEIDRANRPGKWSAYQELMATLRAIYELQEMLGLPGDALREHDLPRCAQHELVRGVLADYRDAGELSLQDAYELGHGASREALHRVEEITAFLRDRPSQRVPYG